MPLGRDDFERMGRGEHVELPEGLFGPLAEEERDWPDRPDLRRAVEWFKGYVGADWEKRRYTAFVRLYAAAIGTMDPSGKGQFFAENDTFGWYLFLADAFLDHPWNYEPMYGSRVIPVFDAIGRNLNRLKGVENIEERLARLVGSERSQPNGGIFELLVASAYLRAGGTVAFHPETRGKGKSYDLDVEIDGLKLAVECKRMETTDYGEKERMHMRHLWRGASDLAKSMDRSTFANVTFGVPVFDVPESYLVGKVDAWLRSGRPSLLWNDEIGHGVVGEPDLAPLNAVLETDDVLTAGSKVLSLITGSYRRHENYIQGLRTAGGMSPRHMGACNLAIVLRWKTVAPAAVDAKAKDVFRKLIEANDQLPSDRPGIIHVGFEAVEGNEAEQARYAKILANTATFDPKGKPLPYVYNHYLIPESPPDEAWVFEERVQWHRITGVIPRPLKKPYLVLPDDHEEL